MDEIKHDIKHNIKQDVTDDILIRRELIRYHSRQASVEGIFREAFETLLEKGYVKETYLDALIARERAHPTALALENINIAIPHADPAHVKKGGIMTVSLEEPVVFHHMLDGSAVEVEYVFFLILTNGNSHLEALSRLMAMMQKKEAVERIRNCRSEEALYEALTDSIKG